MSPNSRRNQASEEQMKGVLSLTDVSRALMTLDLGDLDQPPFVGQWFF